MLIRLHGGQALAGILVAFRENALRLAVAGMDDLVELRWKDGLWVCESGFPVEIDFDPSPAAFERGQMDGAGHEPVMPDIPQTLRDYSARTPSTASPQVN